MWLLRRGPEEGAEGPGTRLGRERGCLRLQLSPAGERSPFHGGGGEYTVLGPACDTGLLSMVWGGLHERQLLLGLTHTLTLRK